MTLRMTVMLTAMTFAGTALGQQTDSDSIELNAAPVAAQSDDAGAEEIDNKPVFANSRGAGYDQSEPTPEMQAAAARKSKADQLRQARALYRSQQRIQRLEMYKWLGHEPLRPSWVTIPSMTSRYGTRTIYVPVYIHR